MSARWACFTPIRLLAAIALALGLVLSAGVPAWAADAKPPPQTRKEADAALREIMEHRTAIQGKTRRGQTLEEAPPYGVVPRKASLGVYPCSNCHDNVFVDTRVRELKDEHTTLKYDHGGGRFWCYDACHNGRDMDHLVSLRRRPIDYDEAYKLCGQCHFQRFKDWSFGGHGRREGAWPVPRDVPPEHDKLRVAERDKIGTWQSQHRTLLSCPACHNPHSPSIKPYALSPVPLVRTGLTREVREGDWDQPIWVRLADTLGMSAEPVTPDGAAGKRPAAKKARKVAKPAGHPNPEGKK